VVPAGAREAVPAEGEARAAPAGRPAPQKSAAEKPASRAGRPAPVEAPGGPPPEQIAREILAALAEHHGEAIETAARAGKLFTEFGPALFAAYDDYRRRAGKGAGADAFRDALRERWGIELPGMPEGGRR
jgi:hypothetical protein